MKTIKIAEATPIQLDWLLAKIQNPGWWEDGYMDGDPLFALEMDDGDTYSPTTYWAQGGPILETEGITVCCENKEWTAYFRDNLFNEDGSEFFQKGETPLIAAMRCYVASKLGETAEIPSELSE